MTKTRTASQKVFNTDLARINAQLEAADAIRTADDGFQWIDESRVPAQLISAYRGLVQCGYANDLI